RYPFGFGSDVCGLDTGCWFVVCRYFLRVGDFLYVSSCYSVLMPVWFGVVFFCIKERYLL
ncbi:hypothetical protein NQU36_26670, partial [Escherichia coli]|uniref:hypothetical protein n=1 Tax=Escherichia coli TaxID=562 RepID=UPI0021190A50